MTDNDNYTLTAIIFIAVAIAVICLYVAITGDYSQLNQITVNEL